MRGVLDLCFGFKKVNIKSYFFFQINGMFYLFVKTLEFDKTVKHG